MMDHLASYRSDSDTEEEEKSNHRHRRHPPQLPRVSGGRGMSVEAAPSVDGAESKEMTMVDPRTATLYYNPSAAELWAPVAGPAAPNAPAGVLQGFQNALTGYVEEANVDETAFYEQMQTFETLGYTVDPTPVGDPAGGHRVVGDLESAAQHNGASLSVAKLQQSQQRAQERRELKRKRREEGLDDAGNLEAFQGPWARLRENTAPLPGEVELTQEQKDYIRSREEAKKRRRRRRDSDADEEAEEEEPAEESFEETTEFFGTPDQLRDYQGRSFIDIPPDLPKNVDPFDRPNRIPQKLVHTYRGHEKGVASIQLFPKSGHLLLSASMDGTARIWDTRGHRKLLRTYAGHSLALRTADFIHDGTQFLTASHDKYVKVWDTETGKVISRHTSRALPLCAKFHPEPSESHGFLVGQDNRKVVQWDTRANEIVQIYDEHLKSVNSVTFIDDNRKFVSTSDDLKALIWEYGIPVVVKHISDPTMHSMPSVTLHPSGKWFAAQSLDNQILLYTARNRFRLNRKKRFHGHQNSSFGIQVGFSPNGRFVMSGDSSGKIFFWDWGRAKVLSKFQAHETVTIGSVWHPLEPSTVFTAGWDGLIKVWK